MRQNSSAHQETTLTVENKRELDDGGMKALERYFDNLADAAEKLKNRPRTTGVKHHQACRKQQEPRSPGYKINWGHQEP